MPGPIYPFLADSLWGIFALRTRQVATSECGLRVFMTTLFESARDRLPNVKQCWECAEERRSAGTGGMNE